MFIHFGKGSHLIAFFLLLVSTECRAATELDKFTQTTPDAARLAFAQFSSCGMVQQVSAYKEHIPFAQVRAHIVQTCFRYLKKADDECQRAGMQDREQRQAVIDKYLYLYLEEAKLYLQGKPIPGFTPDPWVTQTLACGKATDEFVTNYRICMNAAIREIVPFSDDSSNVVADAVVGRCQPVAAGYILQTMQCLGHDTASANASKIVADFRSRALGEIAMVRVQLKKLQEGPPPVSAPIQAPADKNI